MTLGPNYIYKCPNCGNLLLKESLSSGNTLGAELFSDGKRIAPMLPDFPDLTKCKKCNSIFWLSDLKKIGTRYECEENPKNPEWGDADIAEFLDISDLFRALEEKKSKEIIIRQLIWWAFNDRVRDGKEIFVEENEENLWMQNCIALTELFNKENINQKIMIAELYRNLGQFEHCIELIDNLSDDLDWLKNKFKEECAKKNQLVFQLY
jgi:hypothetical protein